VLITFRVAFPLGVQDNHLDDPAEKKATLLKPGKCKGSWRPDKLVGRCFGLKLHNEYEELKSIIQVVGMLS